MSYTHDGINYIDYPKPHRPKPPQDEHQKAIWKRLGTRLDGIDLFHNQLLVVTYVRPTVSRGGIHLPGSVLKEDEYQGKVGLCVKKGPMCFADDGEVCFHGQDVDVGDWLVYRMSDGWQLTISGSASNENLHCRILEDSHVKARISSPEMVF